MPLAHKYCTGKGLELGGASHNPFNLADCINVSPLDNKAFWDKSQFDLCGEIMPVDIYGTAEEIPVASGSMDYIISSHVIEHVPNPIRAFTEWNRVLKPGGIIFMIFPNRNAAVTDRDRPISELQQFIDQFNNPQPLSDYGKHIWIFTLDLMLELIQYCNDNYNLNWSVLLTEEKDSKVGNGHTIIAQKGE